MNRILLICLLALLLTHFVLGTPLRRRGVNDKDDRQYFESDNWHPNIKGSSKWVNEVLFPFLTSKNLFK